MAKPIINDIHDLYIDLLQTYYPDSFEGYDIGQNRPTAFRYIRGLKNRFMNEFQCPPETAYRITAKVVHIVMTEVAEKLTYMPKHCIGVFGQKTMKWITDEAIELLKERDEEVRELARQAEQNPKADDELRQAG